MSDRQRDSFNKWRPRVHLIAPQGWINDPCVPGYNASTGKYHLGFQWNPDGWDWGNIAWGAATSNDLVNWDVSEHPSIAPSATEDHAGVFTGAISPVSLPREGSGDHLTCFYTSAQGSGIHYTRPYKRGSEVLHAATSVDDGLSWQRHPQNPILSGPPDHLSVTGWRDPYIFRWPRLDSTRGIRSGSGLYGIISGGIRNVTPTIFLYTIDAADPTRWTFLSALLTPGLDFSPTALDSDFGVNWEVANITTLQDQDGKDFDILIVGAEGCKVMDDTVMPSSTSPLRAARSGRSQKWLCGDVRCSPVNGEIKMEHRFSGMLDWGMFYAANSFHDPVSNQRVVFGWILEEDLSDELREAQRWSGFISLPRSLSMQTIKGVDPRCMPILERVPGFEYQDDEHGTLNVSTICCQPHPQLQLLRRRKLPSFDTLAVYSSLEATNAHSQDFQRCELHSLEFNITMSFDAQAELFGIDIFHTSDSKAFTRILFEPLRSLIIIHRSRSCDTEAAKAIQTHPEVAHHAFLYINDKAGNTCVPEDLDVRVFFDVSVLEVFVNSRTVVTTRVYPEEGKCFAVLPFVVAKGGAAGVRVKRFEVWELGPNEL